MNTCRYLMLVYLLSITYAKPDGHPNEVVTGEVSEVIDPVTGEESEDMVDSTTPPADLSTRSPDSRVNETNYPVVETKSMLSRMRTLASSLATNVSSNMRPLVKDITQQLQNMKVSDQLQRGVDYVKLGFNNCGSLFGLKPFEFEKKPIEEIFKDELGEEVCPIKNPMSYWDYLTPVTSEAEFIRRADYTNFFPYHVVIKASTDEKEWCQGVLIRLNWILTSKFCIEQYFDNKTEKPLDVFLDAMNSKSILYSNVVLSGNVTVCKILFNPDPLGFDDLALVRLDTVSETTEVPAVALKIPASDIVDEVDCYFVTRCSDGVVRSLLYEKAGMATQYDLKFLKAGALFVCDNNQLYNIQTAGNSFYPLISAMNWIEEVILEAEGFVISTN